MEERLQKLLAAAGIASRRASEALILAGHVTVNGRAVRELGARADADRDDVRVDGRPVRRPATHTYVLLHKPRGYTSTVTDPHAAHTVMELLPADAGRVFPAGRLDRDSEGLLLLTDDGELTARLLHPRYHIPKEYAVLARGRLSEATLRRLRESIPLEGGRTTPAQVESGEPPRHLSASTEPGTVWLRFVLHEGRKRQIRELCVRAGLEVARLVRVRMGPLALGNLRPGGVRRLTADEVLALRRACGLAPPAGKARAGRPPAGTAIPSAGAAPRTRAPGGPGASQRPRSHDSRHPPTAAGARRAGRRGAGRPSKPGRTTRARQRET